MSVTARMEGQKFGRLTVISFAFNHRNSHWNCRCSCGKELIVPRPNLRTGHTRSCGCYNAEVTAGRNYKHGGAYRRLWRIWCSMRQRTREGRRNYEEVSVCDAWSDYDTFRNWALANGYEEHLTIDRWPDPSGNYEPSNCRWATYYQQRHNRRPTSKGLSAVQIAAAKLRES